MQSLDIPEKTDLPTRAFLFPSLIILVFLVLQGGSSLNIFCFPKSLSFLPKFNLACDPALYPFTEFPMFNGTHKLGDQYTNYLLFGISEDSTEFPIGWEDFGFSEATQFSFFNQVIRPLNSKSNKKVSDLSPSIKRNIANIFQYYESLNGRKLNSLRLEKHSVSLTKEGYRKEPVQAITFDARDYSEEGIK